MDMCGPACFQAPSSIDMKGKAWHRRRPEAEQGGGMSPAASRPCHSQDDAFPHGEALDDVHNDIDRPSPSSDRGRGSASPAASGGSGSSPLQVLYERQDMELMELLLPVSPSPSRRRQMLGKNRYEGLPGGGMHWQSDSHIPTLPQLGNAMPEHLALSSGDRQDSLSEAVEYDASGRSPEQSNTVVAMLKNCQLTKKRRRRVDGDDTPMVSTDLSGTDQSLRRKRRLRSLNESLSSPAIMSGVVNLPTVHKGAIGGPPSKPKVVRSTANSSIWAKVNVNLQLIPAEDVRTRELVVLLMCGTFNPVHLMHLRMFYLAKQHLEDTCKCHVLGGILAPLHDSAVRQETRGAPCEVIPGRHRVAMATKAVEATSWLSVDSFAASRKSLLSYPAILRRIQTEADQLYGAGSIRLMYLVNHDQLAKCNPVTMKEYGCVCVMRPREDTRNGRHIRRWRQVDWVHLVEDNAVVTTILESTTENKVRRQLVAGKAAVHVCHRHCTDHHTPSVDEMVGFAVAKYLKAHGIPDKLAGKLPWDEVRTPSPTYTVGYWYTVVHRRTLSHRRLAHRCRIHVSPVSLWHNVSSPLGLLLQHAHGAAGAKIVYLSMLPSFILTSLPFHQILDCSLCAPCLYPHGPSTNGSSSKSDKLAVGVSRRCLPPRHKRQGKGGKGRVPLRY